MADAAAPVVGAADGVGDVPAGGAVAPPAVRDPMDVYLEDVIGVPLPGTREQLIRAGYATLIGLINAGKDFAKRACDQVRKQCGGPEAETRVPVLVEKRLQWLVDQLV